MDVSILFKIAFISLSLKLSFLVLDVSTLKPFIFSATFIYSPSLDSHLNRCLVVEKSVAEKMGYEIVCAVPQIHAGGSFATVTYQNMKEPVLVEEVKADYGLDIGETLIGMHLKSVAVPIRLSVNKLYKANIICAYTRHKYIGGERAKYE